MSSLHSHEINHDTNMPNQSMIWLSYTAASLFVIASFIFVFYFYQTTRSNEQAKKEWYGSYVPLEQLRLYESEQLHTYQWVDQAKGLVKVPIDIAMVELVKEHKSK